MLVIRIIIEIIIFIYMVRMSIKIKQHKIKKNRRTRMIMIFWIIIFVIVVPYSACIPVENFFITFKTPEQAFRYENWLVSKGEIQDVIYGRDSCFVIIKQKEKNDCVSFDSECYKKVSSGYKFIGSFDVGAESISGKGDILWHVNGTKDYYLSGYKWSDNIEEAIDVSDNLGTEFIQKSGKTEEYDDVKIYTNEYYGYVYDMTDQYEIYIDGESYKPTFEYKYSFP